LGTMTNSPHFGWLSSTLPSVHSSEIPRSMPFTLKSYTQTEGEKKITPHKTLTRISNNSCHTTLINTHQEH
jgi:hypothetical protein